MPDSAPAYRDRLPAAALPDGETLIAEIAPDRGRYIRDHVTIAAIGGVIAVALLLILGKSEVIWAGIAGVMGAMALRGIWFYSDVMRARWILSNAALIGPGSARYELSDITTLRPLLGDVQVVTGGGRKALIKHQADSRATIAQISAAQQEHHP